MKKTLPIIEKILKSYVEKLFAIDVETDDAFYGCHSLCIKAPMKWKGQEKFLDCQEVIYY